MRCPKISVVLPVRDCAEYLPQALNSILDQSFQDFELLTIDDGSSDATGSILDGYSKLDSRVRVLRNEPGQGLVASLNRALGLVKGQFIARMDADDIAFPERLQVQHDYLERHDDVGLVASAYYRWRADGTLSLRRPPLSHTEIRWSLIFGNVIPHPAVMFRRNLLSLYKPFYRDVQACEDYELWARLSKVVRLASISEPLMVLRVHDTSVSSLQSEVQEKNTEIVSLSLIREFLGDDSNADQAKLIRDAVRGLKSTAMCPQQFMIVLDFLTIVEQVPGLQEHLFSRVKRRVIGESLLRFPWLDFSEWSEMGVCLKRILNDDPRLIQFLMAQILRRYSLRFQRRIFSSKSESKKIRCQKLIYPKTRGRRDQLGR